MMVRSVLVGFGILLLSALAFAQSGEDPIDQLTKPQTQNTGLQQRFAIPCPSQGRYASFADFFTNCVYDGGGNGILAGGFKEGDGGFSFLGRQIGISYSGLTYVPSPRDRFEGKIVFHDPGLALEEVRMISENALLKDVLRQLWERVVVSKILPISEASILTVYVPAPSEDNASEQEKATSPVNSLVKAVCSLNSEIDWLSLIIGTEPIRVKFYQKSDALGFVGDALFLAKIDALNEASGAKRIHLIALRGSGGWKGAYGEPSTGTLVGHFWNMFDRLSNAVSCRE
jgi:hypothetical protein